MKEYYVVPEIDVVILKPSDIITASGDYEFIEE